MKTTRTVLVTGGSSGLGAAIAERLAATGWTVFASSRRGTLAAGSHASIRAMRCDVRRDGDMREAVAEIIAEEGRLDAIICNAGLNASGPAEELPADRARTIVETNFWGVVNGANAVLPHFRERREGAILVIGSLAGMVSPPGEAYYAASKHAVLGFLESVQYEVSRFGIRVRLVEPGFIRTNLADAAYPYAETIADYDGLREQLAKHWREAIAGGVTPEFVARRIEQVLDDPRSSFRTRVGRDAVWIPRLKALLPARLFFALARRRFGLE